MNNGSCVISNNVKIWSFLRRWSCVAIACLDLMVVKYYILQAMYSSSQSNEEYRTRICSCKSYRSDYVISILNWEGSSVIISDKDPWEIVISDTLFTRNKTWLVSSLEIYNRTHIAVLSVECDIVIVVSLMPFLMFTGF